jgi:phage recombination protein Bet
MENQITTTNGEYGFSREQIELVKLNIAKGASDDELKTFLWTAQRLELDPLSRQIYLIPRFDSKLGITIRTPMVSIDGFRATAAKTNEHAGTDDATFTQDAGMMKSATVTVYRLVGGIRCPFVATARWAEYNQEKSPMWVKMPFTMLGKCAEALALRKAFPAQLSGVYTPEEMDQASNAHPVATVEVKNEVTPAPVVRDEPFPDNEPPRAPAPKSLRKNCVQCGNEHDGPYPRCLECWKAGNNKAVDNRESYGKQS